MSRTVPLKSLNPRWVRADLEFSSSVWGVFGPPLTEDGNPKPVKEMGPVIGVAFDCPLCIGTTFSHPVSVPIPSEVKHDWFEGFPGPWTCDGTLETLTLRPSIWRNKAKHPSMCSLHCWVTKGEVEILQGSRS